MTTELCLENSQDWKDLQIIMREADNSWNESYLVRERFPDRYQWVALKIIQCCFTRSTYDRAQSAQKAGPGVVDYMKIMENVQKAEEPLAQHYDMTHDKDVQKPGEAEVLRNILVKFLAEWSGAIKVTPNDLGNEIIDNAIANINAGYRKSPEPILARNQPCGCVTCSCQDEVQCHGCGAKNCGNKECVFKDYPENKVYAKSPVAVDWEQKYREGVRLKRAVDSQFMTDSMIDWHIDFIKKNVLNQPKETQ